MKMSYLFGARLGTVAGLLRRHGSIPIGRWPLAAALGAWSLTNSALAWRERRTPEATVRQPVFVLGHWRSGTTHLQYLLSQDPRFASPSTVDVCFPHGVGGARALRALLSAVLPRTRLQDGMAFGADVPNEDEIALAALGLPSPYHFWAFPEAEADQRRHLSFAGASDAERRRFVDGLDAYLRRLTAKYTGRTLLLKSPTHTARIELLLSRYPDARFVTLHRDPYAVYASTRHLHHTWLAHTAFLQPPNVGGLDERILSTYVDLHAAYFAARGSVPAGQLHEVAFADLERDPLGELDRLYAALGLGTPPMARFEAYVRGQAAYRKNAYAGLTEAERERVYTRWRRSFREWGYSRSPLHPVQWTGARGEALRPSTDPLDDAP